MSKGSKQRPTDMSSYAANYSAIFEPKPTWAFPSEAAMPSDTPVKFDDSEFTGTTTGRTSSKKNHRYYEYEEYINSLTKINEDLEKIQYALCSNATGTQLHKAREAIQQTIYLVQKRQIND